MNSVFVVIRGGMGNQLFQAAYAISVAKKFNLTIQYVDLTKNAQTPRCWELACFGLNPKRVGFFTTTLIRCLIYFKRKSLSFLPRAFILIEIEEFCLPPAIKEPPFLISGYWQGFKYFQEYESLIRETFKFNNGKPLSRLSGCLAIHVRRGDFVNVTKTKKLHLICDIQWYERAWEMMQKLVPNLKVIVFSDDYEWASKNLFFGNDVEFVKSKIDAPPCEDLSYMSRCDHFIISNSTYSWWAAWLGENPDKKVIAPKFWLNGLATEDIKICPPEWILM